MTKVFVPTVVIDMEVMTKIGKQVWPWEIPVLQAKFGEDMVRVQGELSEIDREELPDAGDEYGRLANAHGSDRGEGGSNRLFVDLAYGHGKAGIDALAKEIKASTKKPRKKAAPKPKPKADPVDGSGEGDPLGIG